MAEHPQSGLAGLPMGWFRGSRDKEISIPCGSLIEPLAGHLENALTGQPRLFCDWVRGQLPIGLHPFEKTVLESDLESVGDLLPPFDESLPVS